jgi:hypothetical protein
MSAPIAGPKPIGDTGDPDVRYVDRHHPLHPAWSPGTDGGEHRFRAGRGRRAHLDSLMQYEETRMRPTDYDFLSNEDRHWVARCRILAAVLFLGLLTGVALYHDGNSVTATEARAATPAVAVTTTAAMAAPVSAATTRPLPR